jgi:hypothetical protein
MQRNRTRTDPARTSPYRVARSDGPADEFNNHRDIFVTPAQLEVLR